MRITINYFEGYPELEAELAQHSPRARAERLRFLAAMGLAFMKDGRFHAPAAPASGQPAAPAPQSAANNRKPGKQHRQVHRSKRFQAGGRMTKLTTWSGRQIDFVDPSPDDVHIVDIATALSRECRYAGHASHFYSVAQHSVLCSRIVLPELAIEALLHDAAEAYIKDIPTPLKRQLPDYKEIEARFDWVIRVHFKIGRAHV